MPRGIFTFLHLKTVSPSFKFLSKEGWYDREFGIHSVLNSPADNMSERRKLAIIPMYMYTVSYQVSDVRKPAGNDLWNLRILHIITCCFGWSLISFLLNGSKISIKTLILICIFIWIIGFIIYFLIVLLLIIGWEWGV